MRPPVGNDIKLGQIAGSPAMLTLPASVRGMHLHVVGATGVGKSKFLENMVRQDILAWSRSRCGLLLLDYHGALYDDVMRWLARHNIKRPVVPIDLRSDDWMVSYNLLRKRQTTEASVIVDATIDGIAHVWGQEGTNNTPLFAHRAANALHVLYENGCTLPEIIHLMSDDRRLRLALTDRVTEDGVRSDWATLNRMSDARFQEEFASTLRRFQRFTANRHMASIFGHPDVSLDMREAIEEGSIILVNLATAGGLISPENAKMFGTLLLTDLWTAAQERGKSSRGVKPFYVYLDEFQRFISPTIAQSLDQARGFGLHLTLAHQFPNQLRNAGEQGRQLYDSVMENASNKIVFRLKSRDNLEPLADVLYGDVLDPDRIKHQLYSTKVMGYSEETRRSHTYGQSESEGRSQGRSEGYGESSGRTNSSGRSVSGQADENDHDVWSESSGEGSSDGWSSSRSTSENESWSRTSSESVTESTLLVPRMGQELSHVQFESLDEQVWRSMAVLRSQDQRQCVARLIGMKAPVSLVTPMVSETLIRDERIEEYRRKCLEALPFAFDKAEAQKRLEARRLYLTDQLLSQREAESEPQSARRPL